MAWQAVRIAWAKRRLDWRWLFGAGLLLLPLLLGVSILQAMLSPPLVLIEAEVGFVRYLVQREDLSSMALDGAEITNIADLCEAGLDEDQKVRAVIRPSLGSYVEYQWLPQHVVIRILSEGVAPAVVENAVGDQCRASSDSLTFVLQADILARTSPLPILGSGQIGAELGVPTLPSPNSACEDPSWLGLHCVDNGHHQIALQLSTNRTLHRATAYLFARTTMPFTEGRLYPISDDGIRIPGGSRLQASQENSPFIGNVTMAADGRSLRAEVTTEANDMQLFRVGQSQQAETLGTGMIARSIRDPSLVPVLFFFALIPIALQLGLSLRDLLSPKRDD